MKHERVRLYDVNTSRFLYSYGRTLPADRERMDRTRRTVRAASLSVGWWLLGFLLGWVLRGVAFTG